MNELKFNSQICTTKEQSQRLLALGLKTETADMYHTTFYRDNVGYEIIQVRNEKLPLLSQEFPAWSLHRLMVILDAPLVEFFISTLEEAYEDVVYNISESIKNGYIKKEYLNK